MLYTSQDTYNLFLTWFLSAHKLFIKCQKNGVLEKWRNGELNIIKGKKSSQRIENGEFSITKEKNSGQRQENGKMAKWQNGEMANSVSKKKELRLNVFRSHCAFMSSNGDTLSVQRYCVEYSFPFLRDVLSLFPATEQILVSQSTIPEV